MELVAVPSVVDSRHKNADPDSVSYYDADPNLTFYFGTIDMYSTFHFDAELDPDPHQSDVNLQPLAKLSDPPRLHYESPLLLGVRHFDVDLGPAFDFD